MIDKLLVGDVVQKEDDTNVILDKYNGEDAKTDKVPAEKAS